MNVRMSIDLRDRAKTCADEIGVPLSEWMARACTLTNRLALVDVCPPETLLSTTREGSVPVTVDLGDCTMRPKYIRRCVARAVVNCERLRSERGPMPKLPPGHYIISGGGQ